MLRKIEFTHKCNKSNQRNQNTLLLPIPAFLTLHHKYIWIIRHLTLAVPSKQPNQQNKIQKFQKLKIQTKKIISLKRKGALTQLHDQV